MFHAPVSEHKPQSSPARARTAQNQDLHSGAATGLTQPRIAALQRAYGNQSVLRMLAETRLSDPFGDKKKSDDNGGPGLPTGIKQFNPKTPNAAASGSPVSLATVEKPKQADWDNGFDEDVAKRFGATRHISLADLGAKIALDPAKQNSRIQQLVIGGHGNKDMLATGSGDGPDTTDALNMKESNKDTWLPFFNSSKFYGQAQIWIYSCNVGNSPIPQLMADRSGSIVYAYTQTAYAKDKSPFQPPPK